MSDSQSQANSNVLTFESPINGSYPASLGAALVLRDESALTKLLVRADDGTGAAGQLNVAFGSSRLVSNVLIVGQRPTEWLLVGSAESVATMNASLDRSGHVSTVDHTHSRAMFRVTGEESVRLLEKVCSVDWDDNMMPNGAVVSASVAKVTCDIIRNDTTQSEAAAGEGQTRVRSYLLACDRSFAQYLFDAVLDAGDEFGVGVETA